jgi:hypothetical protein
MPEPLRQLMASDPRDVLEELAVVREKEKKVAHERELLERVLEILMEGGGEAARWLMDPERGVLTIGPLRDQVLRVMRCGPANKMIWLPREVHESLVQHGNTKVTQDNVRVTMGRMAGAGELVHNKGPAGGGFTLPRDDDPFQMSPRRNVSYEARGIEKS